jgi:diaminohydroxyphosphoribosylaminopyrimidine deaminase/5-amino-6-(5-phosphoribosylamino)uracil reductase
LMAVTSLDLERIQQALLLAQDAIGLSDPNPRVGCLLGDESGAVFGQGFTQAAGSAHAEVMAIAASRALRKDLRGSTAWVTLEPCAHFGRTPPCCDALVDAGVTRCVIAMQDPYPAVSGAGIAKLRAAGVEVVLLDSSELVNRARELNVGFFSRIERGTPWVRLKAAASLDGRSALADGSSQWITGAEARADGHVWRKRASAILTGVGTVLADDPRLDVRAVETTLQPLRIVLDSQLRTPLTAAILRQPGSVVFVAAAGFERQAHELRAAGAEVWDEWQGARMPTLPSLLRQLAVREVNELHVEAGPRVSGSFLDADLVDELLVYIAPLLIGPGRAMADLVPIGSLATARRFQHVDVCPIGADLRLRLVRASMATQGSAS